MQSKFNFGTPFMMYNFFRNFNLLCICFVLYLHVAQREVINVRQ
jgi:hypothetical protein